MLTKDSGPAGSLRDDFSHVEILYPLLISEVHRKADPTFGPGVSGPNTAFPDEQLMEDKF